MFYAGLHRKVTRAGKLVRRGLIILSLLVVGLVPTVGSASAQGQSHSGGPGLGDNCTAWFHAQVSPGVPGFVCD
jgi:hypothetical protein